MIKKKIAFTTVDPAFREPLQAMYEAFNEYNLKHFGNQLNEPILCIVKSDIIVDSCREYSLGAANETFIYLLDELFTYTTNHYNYRLAEGVLLHEMIHFSGIMGHGLKFARECNRIGRAEGLKPVTVQNCAEWTGVDIFWLWQDVADRKFLEKHSHNNRIFNHKKAVLQKLESLRVKVEHIKSKSTKKAFSEFNTELDSYFKFLNQDNSFDRT